MVYKRMHIMVRAGSRAPVYRGSARSLGNQVYMDGLVLFILDSEAISTWFIGVPTLVKTVQLEKRINIFGKDILARQFIHIPYTPFAPPQFAWGWRIWQYEKRLPFIIAPTQPVSSYSDFVELVKKNEEEILEATLIPNKYARPSEHLYYGATYYWKNGTKTVKADQGSVLDKTPEEITIEDCKTIVERLFSKKDFEIKFDRVVENIGSPFKRSPLYSGWRPKEDRVTSDLIQHLATILYKAITGGIPAELHMLFEKKYYQRDFALFQYYRREINISIQVGTEINGKLLEPNKYILLDGKVYPVEELLKRIK